MKYLLSKFSNLKIVDVTKKSYGEGVKHRQISLTNEQNRTAYLFIHMTHKLKGDIYQSELPSVSC